MAEYIKLYPNVMQSDACDKIVKLFEVIEPITEDQKYAENQNVLSRCINVQHALERTDMIAYSKVLEEIRKTIFKVLDSFINNIWIPNLQDEYRDLPFHIFSELTSSGYELRKIHGSTFRHVDGVFSNGAPSHYYRVASVIMTLSESNDELVFPMQNKTVKLEKGSFVVFPPYWMFPHYSNYKDIPRYSVQTWLLGKAKDV